MNLEWRKALRGSQAPQMAKLVGLILDTYADKHGHCWPSRPTLAAGASCDVRTVDYSLRQLEERGFVTVERSRGRAVNHYWLKNPNGEPGSLSDSVETSEEVALRESSAVDIRGNGERDHGVTANVVTGNGEGGSPEAGSKPPENQPENLHIAAPSARRNGAARQSTDEEAANGVDPNVAELLRAASRGDFLRSMPA